MTQAQKIDETQKSKSNDRLARVRTGTQELHAAISDAAAKRGEAMKGSLHSILPKAKALTASLKKSLGAQPSDAIKTHLAEAVPHLEAVQKHLGESLKMKGHELEDSIRWAITSAHAAAQKVSEALAAKRTAESTHAHS